MRPALVASVLAALAAAVAIGATNLASTPRVAPLPRPSANRAVAPSLCPRGTLPDNGVCIPVPPPPVHPMRPSDAERVPRLPSRDADYTRYALPVANDGLTVTDATSALPDGGSPLDGIFVTAALRAPVTAVTLEGQEGPTLAVYAGPLVGATLVSYHVVHASDRRREYVVVLGNLDSPASFAPRAALTSGTVVGKVAPTPLYIATRLVRAGTDVWSLSPKQLLDDANTVSVDPRNVLGKN